MAYPPLLENIYIFPKSAKSIDAKTRKYTERYDNSAHLTVANVLKEFINPNRTIIAVNRIGNTREHRAMAQRLNARLKNCRLKQQN